VQGQSPYDYFPGTYETDLARYPSGEMISLWMKEAGFVGCERRIAARIEHDFIGRKVLSDPVLQKNGTSQLSLLTEDAFVKGMARIREAIQLAERRGQEIVFPTHIALPIVVGFVPDAKAHTVMRPPAKRLSGLKQEVFEAVLGKPVEVALIESVKRGAQTCRFTIIWL
jgi:hypothetical protein